MKIAYFTNVYPHVRHTFIRREITALEQQGQPIVRFSIRRSEAKLIDPADLAEQERTRVIFDRRLPGLLWALLASLVGRPWRFVPAVGQAFALGWRAGKLLRHAIYLAEACVLRKWLCDAGVDHVHVHFATNPATVALLVQTLGGPAYSLTIHGPEEWDQPEALSLPQKYINARFVVAVSHYGRAQVLRFCRHEHWQRVRVIRCGVDASFLHGEPTPVPDTSQLVCVGGLVAQKGHLILLESLHQLQQEGVPFTMALVGDGPLRPLLERRIRELDLFERVHLLGWQSNAGVREQLLASRALVMASLAENLPVAMMEALALGRPVIGTYLAGIPELIEPGVTGFLVPASDAVGLAQMLRRVLQTEVAELTALSQQGAARVAQQHDVSCEAAKLAQCFRAIASDHRGSGITPPT